MALTPAQNRSMDNYLYKGKGTSFPKQRPKKEFELQEKSKENTEELLDVALKQLEDSNE